MSDELIIERYGNLLKQEMLVSMEAKTLPQTFVLEAPEPFPGFFGYYNDAPVDAKPLYVYLVLKEAYSLEAITRAFQLLKRSFPAKRMAATLGTVSLNADLWHVVRIRHLDSYDQVVDIQRAFADLGFGFAKKPSHPVRDNCLIRIEKFFVLKEIDDDVFLDMTELDHGYFVIPRQLKWDEFQVITKQVKFNWDKPSFDAAIGHFHHQFGIVDMVRIYNPHINLDFLTLVRNKYLSRIK